MNALFRSFFGYFETLGFECVVDRDVVGDYMWVWKSPPGCSIGFHLDGCLFDVGSHEVGVIFEGDISDPDFDVEGVVFGVLMWFESEVGGWDDRPRSRQHRDRITKLKP